MQKSPCLDYELQKSYKGKTKEISSEKMQIKEKVGFFGIFMKFLSKLQVKI